MNNVGINTATGKMMFDFTANTGFASTLESHQQRNRSVRHPDFTEQRFQTASGAFHERCTKTESDIYYISNRDGIFQDDPIKTEALQFLPERFVQRGSAPAEQGCSLL